MFPLFLSRRDVFFSALAAHGLTPTHGIALMGLLGGPQRMSAMAGNMACDASYITAVVDRLESLGLASRRQSDTDRRVREIVLTPKGRKVAASLQETMATPPAEMAALSEREAVTLARILRKVQPAEPPSLVPRLA